MASENLGASFSIDVTELKAGLAQANRLIRESESEFKAAAAGMDDWSKSQKGLEAKLKSLNDITSIQEKKVSALQAEYDRLIEGGLDPASREATELRTKINNETAALEKNKASAAKLEKALAEMADEMDESGDKAKKAKKEVKDVGESAEDAAEGFTIAKGAVASFIGDGLTALAGAAKNAIGNLTGLAEATREYRTELAKIETVAELAGASTDVIKDKWHDLGAVLGDEGAVAEGLNNLVSAGFTTEKEISTISKYLEGAAIKWKDTLKFEGLADGLQETLATGKSVGPFAELLERAGVNLETFDEQLAACTTEAEKQNLVLNKLSHLGLAEISDAYREQNKELIEANKSQSELADTQAELGAAMEPVNTAVTQLKTAFVKEFSPAITQKVIPAVQKFIKKLSDGKAVEKFGDILEFAADNAEWLAVTAVGTVAALKGFSIVKGLTTAIKAVTGAQKAWNIAMTANPIGAVVTAVGLLAAGVGALKVAYEAKQKVLNKEVDAAKESLEVIREQKEAYLELKEAQAEQAAADLAQLGHVEKLNAELGTLVDANGKVKKGEEDRARFILNELNGALGTELEMTDGQIQNYKDLEAQIYKTIEAKKAEILLGAQLPLYEEAVTNLAKAEQDRTTKAIELAEARKQADEAEMQYKEEMAVLSAELQTAQDGQDSRAVASVAKKVGDLKAEYEREQEALRLKNEAYLESDDLLSQYYSDIARYEEANALLLAGKTDEAIALLDSKNGALKTAKDLVSQSTEEQKAILEQQVIDTEVNAKLMREAYENGVEGVTEDMVKTAEEQARQAKIEFKRVGGDLVYGIAEGANSAGWAVNAAVQRIINDALAAARAAADSHSPSRKFRDLVGITIPQGIAVGIDKGTDDVLKAINKQVGAMEEAYDTDAIAMNLSAVNTRLASPIKKHTPASQKANDELASGSNGKTVVINQTNNYSQAHSRREIRESSVATVSAVRLALGRA